MAGSNGLTRTATKESHALKGEPMRSSTWVLMACCTPLLVACGADLPPVEAAPEPRLATNSAALVTVNRVVSNGASIDVTWGDELGEGYATAGTDTTNRVSTAFLTATQVIFDPASQVCTADPLLGTFCHYTQVWYDAIYANFNPGDLKIGANTASLKVDLATASNLTFTRCVYDETVPTTTCGDLTNPGTINLTWRKTSTDYVKSKGTTETKTGPQTVRVTGSRQSFSADVSGTFAGTALSHKPGGMGTNNTTTIDILRTP
jgi:hypothetical protein